MVDVAPFRALRVATNKKSNDISGFICPPYDVISPAERAALAKKSPNNVVLLELPDGEGLQKYENGASVLRAWKSQNIVQLDRSPSYYLLETTYKISDPFAPSKKMKRYGVLLALRLETPGKGAVRPHEKTLPKAKEDRLHLLSALQTNVSPIFGLFFDKKNEWRAWVGAVTKKKPLVVGTEKKDLSHRLWKVEDEKLQHKLAVLLKGKELFIADGHHRYEVAWAYKENQLQQSAISDRFDGWNSVMTYVCPMEEAGLVMLPTHRLVRSSLDHAAKEGQLKKFFNIKPVKNLDALIKILSAAKKKERSIGWATQRGCFLLTPKKDVSLDRALADRPQALKELDVVVLHDVALGEYSEIIYSRDMKEIKNKISDPSWSCFLLSSPGVASLARVSMAGEVMPPKTTYFYPKVPTGFTMMPLDQKIG